VRWLLDLVWTHLAPALGGSGRGRDAELAARLASLALPEPAGASIGMTGILWYDIAPNDVGVTSLGFEFADGRCVFTLDDARGAHRIDIGLGHAVEGDTSMTGQSLHHEYQPDRMRVLARGVWQGAHRFCMTWRFIETAFCDTVVCAFEGDTVTVDRSVNANTGSGAWPTLVGVRRVS